MTVSTSIIASAATGSFYMNVGSYGASCELGTQYNGNTLKCYAKANSSVREDMKISAHGMNDLGRFDFGGSTDQDYGLLVTREHWMGFYGVNATYEIWSDDGYSNQTFETWD